MPRSRPGSAGKRRAVDRMRARVGALTPSSMRRKVVLPQPLAPTMVTKLPLATSSVDPLEHAAVAERLPDALDLRPGSCGARPRGTAAATGQAEQAVHDEGQQRDPGDVGQDHVHGEEAAHQEDAIAQALGGRRSPRPRSGTARPARATGAGRDDQPRQDLRQRRPAGHDLPGRGAQGLRLDQQLRRAARATRKARSRTR